MLRRIKLISFFMSLVFLLDAAAVVPVSAAGQEINVRYEHCDTENLKSILSDFYEKCKIDNNEEAITDLYFSALEEYERIYAMSSLAMIQYYAEISEKNMNEYTYSGALSQTAFNMIINTLVKAYNNTQYSDLIDRLSGITSASEDNTYDTDMSGYREKEMEIQQRYLEIRQQTGVSADQIDYMAAELYVEYAKLLTEKISHYEDCNNYWTYMYDMYNRDYTINDVKKLSSSLKEYLKKYFNYTADEYNKCDFLPARSDSLVFDDNIQILRKYAGEISGEAAESAAMLDDNSLYLLGGGKTSRDMTFTTYLYLFDVPYMYQYIKNNNYDLHTTIHEFGHFNSMSHPSEYIYCTKITGNSLDIAELQSQGMSVMFTTVFDEIYGNYSKPMKLYEVYNLIHTVAMSFLVNDIEQYVFENADTISAGDVIKKYNELKEEYQIVSARFGTINHIFEMPFYYISYGVSALATFELWDKMNSDYDCAVDMYTAFTHINSFDTEKKFISSLKETGFKGDIFNASEITETIENVVYHVSGQFVYGDADGNGAVCAGDIVYLFKKILSTGTMQDKNEFKRCDLNKDKSLDIRDLVILKNMLL